MAFGVEAYWTEDAPATGLTTIANTTANDAPGAGATAPNAAPDGPGAPYATPPVALTGPAAPAADAGVAASLGGGLTSAVTSPTAYLFAPERSGAAPLAFALLAAGYRVNVTTDTVEAGGRFWPRGTFVALAEGSRARRQAR